MYKCECSIFLLKYDYKEWIIMLKGEIKIMKLLSEKYSENIQFHFETPKKIDEIRTFEKEIGIQLPAELTELDQLTNGFNSFMTYMNLWSLEMINTSMRGIMIGSRKAMVIGISC